MKATDSKTVVKDTRETEPETDFEVLHQEVTITLTMNLADAFKIMRCLKKHEPEIYEPIRQGLFDSIENGKVKFKSES